jgi:arylformamidase
VGSHVDAPYHVAEEGGTTDTLPLSTFVGEARVFSAEGASSIRPAHVDDVSADRVLFKTEASRLSDDEWPESITPVDPDTIHSLAETGAVLIGTDAPSVDPLESSTLPAHHALIETGLVNLEGLCLENVPPGLYYLMALPLKIPQADAAPVRAVLLDHAP